MSTLTQPAPAPLRTGTARRRTYRAGAKPRTIAAFLLPFFIPFLLFYIVPVLYALTQSFLKVERGAGQYGKSSVVFGGFTQYADVFTNGEFWASIGRTAVYGVVQVPVMLALSLIIALLLDSTLVRAKAFFRITAFLPYAIPGVIAAIMWSFLYHPQISPIVSLFKEVGINLDFLSSSSILFSIANVSTWLWTGYNMLIIYSALQAIPQEVYEAAKIDGASSVSIAVRIKIPMILPSIVLTSVFSIIGTLQLYTEPTVLAQVAPSISSTFTPNMMAYAIASGNNYQQAAAMSVVIAIATFILSFGFMKLTSRKASL